MQSQEHLYNILTLISQLKEEIHLHKQAVADEATELQFCEEFQQDLLHIIEGYSTSGSESAALMSKLRRNRVRRRDIKDSQQINQRFGPALTKLTATLQTFPNTITSYEPSYTLKTKQGLELLDSLDAERKRSQVTYYFKEKNIIEETSIEIEKTSSKEAQSSSNKTNSKDAETNYICQYPTQSSIHLIRLKKNWKLIENDTVIYFNKKLQTVASYIVNEGITVYIEQKFSPQLKKLIEEHLKTQPENKETSINRKDECDEHDYIS